MIGLLGIGLGMYGIYELTKEVKTTKQDFRIKEGIGSIIEQKSNIDKYFIDILEYGGAECTIKNNKVIKAKPQGYGGTEIYLMEKGYSKEAIEYFKQKYDDISKTYIKKEQYQKTSRIKEFEKALQTQETTEMVIKFSTNATKHTIDIMTKEIIKYLHNHHNENARVNVTMGSRISNNDFQISWILFVPNGYDGHQYIEDIENTINMEMI